VLGLLRPRRCGACPRIVRTQGVGRCSRLLACERVRGLPADPSDVRGRVRFSGCCVRGRAGRVPGSFGRSGWLPFSSPCVRRSEGPCLRILRTQGVRRRSRVLCVRAGEGRAPGSFGRKELVVVLASLRPRRCGAGPPILRTQGAVLYVPLISCTARSGLNWPAGMVGAVPQGPSELPGTLTHRSSSAPPPPT
jgi:hypothetical protein